jgi:ATP-dependent DNA helicase RecG
MKSKEKENVMERMKKWELDILVSTSVVEVGVDIQNATVMVIEGAERFGLAALHQLRGRIGRGGEESLCFLFADPKTPEAKARIKAMLESNDGFHLAEVDLKLRGPGEFYGVRQSGLPAFRIADIITDEKILTDARHAASELLACDPKLMLEDNNGIRQALYAKYGKFLELGTLD